MTSDLERRVDQLAKRIIGPREDWQWMLPELVSDLRCAIGDFWTLHRGNNQIPGFETPEQYRAHLIPFYEAMEQWESQETKREKKPSRALGRQPVSQGRPTAMERKR